MFSYDDPVDGSHAANQGVRLVLSEADRAEETLQLEGDEAWNARAVFRLSGTGVGGATLRMYLERYAAPGEGKVLGLAERPKEALAKLAGAAAALARIAKHTGAEGPTTIT